MSLYPHFNRVYLSDVSASTPVIWLPFRGRDLFVATAEESVTLLTEAAESESVLKVEEATVLGQMNGVTYLAGEIASDAALPSDWQATDLRKLYGYVSEQEWAIAGYASQVLHWQRISRFCPACGEPMGAMEQEWMRRCARCDHVRYPPVSPATLILVHDGADRVLLSHQPGWGKTYSILAGFVLPGESLEECVHREVEEEVAIRITDLVYQGSQPWPFPHQLMIGFTAQYRSGDLRIDDQELDHAAWFDFRELPALPPPLSLSRRMIDAWSQARQQAKA